MRLQCDNKDSQKKVDTDIFNGSRVIKAQSFQFDLKGQVDLGGQRSIFVFVENHGKKPPKNISERLEMSLNGVLF